MIGKEEAESFLHQILPQGTCADTGSSVTNCICPGIRLHFRLSLCLYKNWARKWERGTRVEGRS